MINETFDIPKEEKKSLPLLPENIYQVELLDVNCEERPTYDTKNKLDGEKIFEKVLKFQFVLLRGTDIKAEKEEYKNLRGRSVWENFVQTSLYIGNKGKNKLYQIVEALIGRLLTPEEEATFSSQKVNELIGMQCRVGIKHKATEKATYANIDTYYFKEQDLTPLTDEEKEKAMPKEDTEPAEGTPEHPQYAPAPKQEEQGAKPTEFIPF